MSFAWDRLPSTPKDDPLQESVVAFSRDTSPTKVNLLMGVFCGPNGKPWVLPTVKKVAQLCLDDKTQDYAYGPILGNPEFLEYGKELLFGADDASLNERIASVQTISGTGACRMGAHLLVDSTAPKTVWLSDPGWKNFEWIWAVAGPQVNQRNYPYFDGQKGVLDFQRMIGTLEKETKPGDVVVLQVCAHNPTGCDPSKDQWKEIFALCMKKKLFVFMDCAYQGLASDDMDGDAWPIRYLAQQGVEFAVAQSFSKNFGLYGERTGIFHFVTPSIEHKRNMENVFIHFHQSEILTPPRNGAQIVARILKDPKLRTSWLEDLGAMRKRISDVRKVLYKELTAAGDNTYWGFVLQQSGLFCYIELDKNSINWLMENNIYLMAPGRLSISALNGGNIQRVAKAIASKIEASENRFNYWSEG